MKSTILSILTLMALGYSSQAASFDKEAYGDKLSGWDKNGTASYSFTDAKYRSHMPTITHSPLGAMFVTTQVDMFASAGKGAVCQLALTFAADGVLQGLQIKAAIHGKALDTGMVRRPQASEGGAPSALAPSDEMVVEVFSRFDSEMQKVLGAKESTRADFFSRLFGGRVKSANLAAGLRHNVNLMLQCVSAK